MFILGHRGTGVTMRNTPEQEEVRRQENKRSPENTIAAFIRALACGADGLEIDVIRTKDNDLAVCHDEQLNLHVVNANRPMRELGFIYEKTMDELRALDLGDGQGMPSLNDVFNLLSAHVFNIELKGRDCYAQAHGQAKAAHYPPERLIYSSFDHGQLAQLRALDPTAKIGLLFETTKEQAAPLYPETPGDEMSVAFSPAYVDSVLDTIKPTSLHPWIGDFNEEMAAYAKAKNLDIYVWTMREQSPAIDPAILNFARQYQDDPAVHLITDYPVEIVRALRL